MKMIKLLLIGLLSVVAFVACSEDEAAPTSAVRIVLFSDNATAPVFYDNATIALNAIGVDGKVLPAAKLTWDDNVTGNAFNSTDKTIKAVPTTKGDIQLSYKTGTGDNTTYDNVTLTVVPSTVKPTSVVITTPDNVTEFTDTTLTIQLTTKATYAGIVYDVTGNTAYTVAAPATEATLNVSSTGLATATGTFAASVVTGTFNTKTGTVTMTSKVADKVLETLTLKPATAITLPKGATATIAAEAKYVDVTAVTDVTATAVWASSTEGTATVAAGVITGKADSGTTDITAAFGGKTTTAVVVSGSAAVLKTAEIVAPTVLTGAADATLVAITLTGKDTAGAVATAPVVADFNITSTPDGVATIDALGVITLKTTGEVTVTVTQKTPNAYVPAVVATKVISVVVE